MKIKSIFTRSGTRTIDNQDVVVAFIHGGCSFSMVLDGCSQRSRSGEFANAFAGLFEIEVKKLKLKESSLKGIIECMFTIFQYVHKDLRMDFSAAAFSFMLVIEREGIGLVFHLGDCGLGRLNRSGNVTWVSKPHTLLKLPMRKLQKNPARHILNKSFKAKRYAAPEYFIMAFRPRALFIIASDGFWGDMSPCEQHNV